MIATKSRPWRKTPACNSSVEKSQMRHDTPDGRFYEITCSDGSVRRMPSVTTILNELNKPWLANWSCKLMAEYVRNNVPLDQPLTEATLDEILTTGKRQHRIVLETAGAYGSGIHDAIQRRLETGKYPTQYRDDPATLPCLRAFEGWWKEQRLTPLLVETVVWSERYGFAGTCDLIARHQDGTLFCGDWKTSNHMQPGYAIQACCYATAHEERTGDRISTIAVVRIEKKTGGIEVLYVEPDEREMLLRTFLAIMDVWRWRTSYKCRTVKP